MGRKPILKNSVVISVRFDLEEYTRVQDIAALETISTGKLVTAVELIRQAVHFTYGDNERLRECFRRSRQHITKRY